MKWKIKESDNTQDLFQRLIAVRNIQDSLEDFLNPSYKKYRNEPSTLNDIDKATDRIVQTIHNNEKIMIFGDYDVDGIISSYALYTFFRKYAGYHQVSIMLPHRKLDGYGIKNKHIKEIHERGCSVIITVDNGITSVDEAAYAKELGIDLIITDHHQILESLPEAYALVNPQLSSKLKFKEICGATVARKLALHLSDKLNLTEAHKEKYLQELLPYIGIATVADCMPLIDENRLIVKKALHAMNTKRNSLSRSLAGFISYLGIKQVDTYHIGFMIAPRLNATGRVGSAHDGLDCLLCTDLSKQKKLLEHVDELNNQRKEQQDIMLKKAKEKIDLHTMVLCAADEEFEAGIAGIVAGRLTEKNYKPAVILDIDSDTRIASGSLRGPDYFNIVQMLQDADELLIRYGGHEQAGGLTVHSKNIEALFGRFNTYAHKQIGMEVPEKVTMIDTILLEHELDKHLYEKIEQFGPYGIGNQKPVFMLSNVIVDKVEKIGKKERTHLKIHAYLGKTKLQIMRWGKGDEVSSIPIDTPSTLIGSIKKDDRNGGWFFDAIHLGTDVDI